MNQEGKYPPIPMQGAIKVVAKWIVKPSVRRILSIHDQP
jgi:hypothetical protein